MVRIEPNRKPDALDRFLGLSVINQRLGRAREHGSVVRVQLKCTIESSQGFFKSTCMKESSRLRLVQPVIEWSNLKTFFRHLQRQLQTSFAAQGTTPSPAISIDVHPSESTAGFGIFWIECQRLLEASKLAHLAVIPANQIPESMENRLDALVGQLPVLLHQLSGPRNVSVYDEGKLGGYAVFCHRTRARKPFLCL